MSETNEGGPVAESRQRLWARKQMLIWAICMSIAAFICVVIAARCGRTDSTWLSAIGQGLLCAGGPSAVGILIGFLFGIPRATPQPNIGAKGANGKDGPDAPSTSFRPNTNLEEISDWLTKILLGASLTQLKTIATTANDAASALGILFGGGDAGHTIGGLVIAFFTIAGFFTGYLITYLFLTREFRDLYHDLSDAGAEANAILKKLPEDRRKEVREQLKERSTPASKTTDDLRSVEAVMLASLYDDAPDGFKRAIDAAQAYLKDLKKPQSASFHAWLACAYGQRHRWDVDHQAKPADLKTTHDLALRAARTALELDPAWKDVLAGTLTSDRGDDDLRSFKDDPDFKALLL
jgi:hypothetical protein